MPQVNTRGIFKTVNFKHFFLQAPGNPRHPFPEARPGGYVAPHTGGPPGWAPPPSQYPASLPSPTLAALNSPSIPMNSPSMALNSPSPASSSNSHLAAAMMGAQGRRGSTPQPMLRHPLQSPSQQQQQMMQQSPSQQQMQMQSPQSMLQSPQAMMQQSPQQQMMQSPQQPMLQQQSPNNMLQSPPSNMLQSPQSFPQASPQPLEPLAPAPYSPSVPVQAPPTIPPPPPAVERKPVNFFELYSALNKEEYDKMTTCRSVIP